MIWSPAFLVTGARRRGDGREPPDAPLIPPAGPNSFNRLLGMWLFLATVVVLFGGLLTAFLAIRFWQPQWPSPGLPRFGIGFVVSTVLLVTVGLVLEAAIELIRRETARAVVVRWLSLAAALGCAFLVCQAINWSQFLETDQLNMSWQVAGIAYVLTAVHALHVIGGIGPLALIVWHARRGDYSRQNHLGVRLCAMYWHLLDIVWLIMLAAMYLPTPGR